MHTAVASFVAWDREFERLVDRVWIPALDSTVVTLLPSAVVDEP